MAQNILHGLSPGLSDAINSISRWKFIKSSFPHIIHATASSLIHRKDQAPSLKLGKTEIKLLYTLHWLILDAASECEDNNNASAILSKFAALGNDLMRIKSAKKRESFRKMGKYLVDANETELEDLSKTNKQSENYLHSIATIQLFVYFFAPILKTIKPSDLDNLKLNNGLKIWEPLWSHKQPNILIFNTPVKCKSKSSAKVSAKNTVSSKAVQDQITPSVSIEPTGQSTAFPMKNNFGDIYMGKRDDKCREFSSAQDLSNISKTNRTKTDDCTFEKSVSCMEDLNDKNSSEVCFKK